LDVKPWSFYGSWNKAKNIIYSNDINELSGLIIGGDRNNYLSEGRIDEMRIWNKALTRTQINEMMNSEIENDGSGGVRLVGTSTIISGLNFCNDLNVYYKFNETTTTGGVKDSSCNGNDASHEGMDDANIGDPDSQLRKETKQTGGWGTESTWKDNILPNNADVVYIQNAITINDDVSIQKAHINSNILIEDGQSLTVEKLLDISNTITIEEGGSLVQKEGSTLTIVGAGKIISKRTDAENEYKYQYWSSPVHDTNDEYKISDSWQVGDGENHDSRWMFMLKGSWEEIDGNTIISAGYGFTIKPEIGGGNEQIFFEGIPNNGDVIVDVSSVPNGEYVIIGNPYPSAIKVWDIITDIEASGVAEGTFYLWDSTGNSSSHVQRSGSGYATVTKATGTAASDGGDLPSGYISTGQGFMIKIIDNTKNIVFKNSHRKTNNNTQFYKRNISNDILLRLNLKGDQDNFSQAVVIYNDISTNNYDNGYDANALKIYNTNINTIVNNKEFTINSLNKSSLNEIIELGVETGDIMPYTISLIESMNIDNDIEVILNDKILGTNTNLLENKYEFTPNNTDQIHENRFSIEIKQQTLSENDNITLEKILWNISNNTLTLDSKNNFENTKLDIIDINGRIVKSNFYKGKQNNLSLRIDDLNSGVYIYRVNGRNTYTSDMFIIK